MAKRKFLVIDANVLCSAGEAGRHGSRPVICSQFLTAVLGAGHGIAITDAILAEWKRHRSRFSSRWLRAMFARRRVFYVNPPSVIPAERIGQMVASRSEATALRKDIHLIEAAIASDQIVASLDEVTRRILKHAASVGQCADIAMVIWVNPERDGDGVVPWLYLGAPAEETLRLGFVET